MTENRVSPEITPAPERLSGIGTSAPLQWQVA
jgi:hypothetical protein